KAYAYNTISDSMCKSSVSNYKTKYRLSTPSLTKVICSGTKKYTATWKKNSKASGYQIEYGTSSALTNATKVKITSTSTTSKKVTVSKSQKNYYVRIRSYVTVGKYTYYSGWSSKVKVYVK
nr:hypothetical protein [Lachnospiraceae bacterium]